MRMYEVTKLDLERKDKEHQKLEEDLGNLRKELEKCKDEFKVRIKYEGSTDSLDKMLSKQKHSKDIEGVGFDFGHCSTSRNSLNKEIQFVSSIDNSKGQTFNVSKPTDKKTYATSTRNQYTDPKRKAKMDDEGFTKVKDTRRKSLGRPSYADPRRPMRNNFKNDWYVPQFHGYCYKCKTYGHRILDCELMHISPPSFESRNQFCFS